MDEDLQALEKAAHYYKDKDPEKYKQKLAELRRERKKPGSKERAYQQVLQAKRREKGGPGTKSGKNGSGHQKGRMKQDTGKAAKQYQSSEKKAGTKLSPDRKDNSKGYGDGNTRNVPQKLNRGRHNVDTKKLENWKKKLKKNGLSVDGFVTLLRAKALENNNEDLYKTLTVLDVERLVDSLLDE